MHPFYIIRAAARAVPDGALIMAYKPLDDSARRRGGSAVARRSSTGNDERLMSFWTAASNLRKEFDYPDRRICGDATAVSSKLPACSTQEHDRGGRGVRPFNPLELTGRNIYVRRRLLPLSLA